MRQIIIFKDGTRIAGDSQALILPQHPAEISTAIPVGFATEEEWKKLQENPADDTLINTVKGRRKRPIVQSS